MPQPAPRPLAVLSALLVLFGLAGATPARGEEVPLAATADAAPAPDLESEPRTLVDYEALARRLREAGREDEVTVLLEALVARQPTPAAFRLLADHYRNRLPRSHGETIHRWRQRFPDDHDAIREQLIQSGWKLDRGEAATLADRLLAVPAPANEAERDMLSRGCWAFLNAELPQHYEQCMRRVLAAAPDGGDANAAGALGVFLVDEERWSDLEALVAGARPEEAVTLSRRLANEAASYARAGRCAVALRALEHSRPSPGDVERSIDVAETLTYCGDRERGAAGLLAIADSGRTLTRLSWRLRSLPGDPAFLAPLVEALQARLAETPEDADLNEALAAVLEPSGDVKAAVRHLLTWSALAPDDAKIPLRLGQLLRREGEPAAAAAAFADALAHDHANANAWDGLVEAQLAAGLYAAAARNAEAASVAGERVSSRLMAMAAERQQSWRSAADHWARHLALAPPSELPWQAEQQYLLALKQLGELESIDAWLTARAPLASDRFRKTIEVYLGEAWQRLGLPARSRPHYEAALAADPEDDYAAFALAQVASDEGKVKEAAALYRRSLARDPTNGTRAGAVARYLREHGDAAGALAVIRPAAEKERVGSSEVRAELARGLRAAGDAEASLALADQLLGENEQAHLVRLERGEALAALGRNVEARATFDDFLERTATLAARRHSCNCNCDVLQARDELLVRLRAPAGTDAAVAATGEPGQP